MPGIDLLLTGHTHGDRPAAPHGTWISASPRFGNTLTRFDLTFAKEKEGAGRSPRSREEPLPMKGGPAGPGTSRRSPPSARAPRRSWPRRPRRWRNPHGARRADGRHSASGLAARRTAGTGKADLSFASLLPGSLPDWPAGPLTVGQIWAAIHVREHARAPCRPPGARSRRRSGRPRRCISGVAVRTERPSGSVTRRSGVYNCDTLRRSGLRARPDAAGGAACCTSGAAARRSATATRSRSR